MLDLGNVLELVNDALNNRSSLLKNSLLSVFREYMSLTAQGFHISCRQLPAWAGGASGSAHARAGQAWADSP